MREFAGKEISSSSRQPLWPRGESSRNFIFTPEHFFSFPIHFFQPRTSTSFYAKLARRNSSGAETAKDFFFPRNDLLFILLSYFDTFLSAMCWRSLEYHKCLATWIKTFFLQDLNKTKLLYLKKKYTIWSGKRMKFCLWYNWPKDRLNSQIIWKRTENLN